MIITQLDNPDPFLDFEGMATKIASNIIPESPTAITTSFDIKECSYIEKVFAELGGDDYKNDKNDFLFTKKVSTDTIVLKLFKNCVELATITDNTYGTFYDFGDLGNNFYIGFVIEWEKVLNVSGLGEYYIVAETNILGVLENIQSRCFKLLPYSDEIAHNTVRIETIQKGNILRSEFDYTDILESGWYSSIRIPGKFGSRTPTLVTDKILNQSYEEVQIQDSIEDEWKLITELIPLEVINTIIYDGLLSNSILITGYDVYNEESYIQKSLYPKEITETKHYSRQKKRKYIITYSDKKPDIIKRNY